MSRATLILGLALAPLAACADRESAPPAVAAVAAAASPAAAAGTAGTPARPDQLGLCVACHGEDGISRIPGTPHLGGQDQLYLERALGAYRSGERRHVPMSSLANSLQPKDIEALAAWYASRPGFAGAGAP